jgi:hypothetical protein
VQRKSGLLRKPVRTDECMRIQLPDDRIALLHDRVRLHSIGADLLRACGVDAR